MTNSPPSYEEIKRLHEEIAAVAVAAEMAWIKDYRPLAILLRHATSVLDYCRTLYPREPR